MPELAPEIKSVDDVGAAYRWMYKQEGDVFKLDTENAAAIENLKVVNGLEQALKRSRKDVDEAKKLKVDISPLSEYGLTTEEIKASFEKKKTELEEQIKGVNVNKIREGIIGEYAPKLTALEQENKSVLEQLQEELVSRQAVSAISAEKGDVELLMPHLQKQVKVLKKDGKLTVNVVDEAGETRYTGATPTTITELVKEMKADKRYGKCFDSEAPAGTGTRPVTKPTPTYNNTSRGMGAGTKPNDKIAAGIRKGQVEAR